MPFQNTFTGAGGFSPLRLTLPNLWTKASIGAISVKSTSKEISKLTSTIWVDINMVPGEGFCNFPSFSQRSLKAKRACKS